MPIERELSKQIKEALKEGKRWEIDCAQVVRAEDYVEPPKMKGYVNADGVNAAEQLKQLESKLIEETSDEEPQGSSLEPELSEIAFDSAF